MQAFTWQPVINPADLEYREHGGLMDYSPPNAGFATAPPTDPVFLVNPTHDDTDCNYLPDYMALDQSNRSFKLEPQESLWTSSVEVTEPADWTLTASTSPPSRATTPSTSHQNFPAQISSPLDPSSEIENLLPEQELSTPAPSQQFRQRGRYRAKKAPSSPTDPIKEYNEKQVQSKSTNKSKPNLQERNRLAASKCRRKQLHWEHDLERGKEHLKTENSKLQKAHRELTNEVITLKSLLMEHINCSDTIINLWIRNEAQRFVSANNSKT